MSLKCPLGLIDAFVSETPFSGNPAGVCLVEEFPETSVMQGVAFEMQWSETAFLKKIAPDYYHIRWFSPEDEAPMCGHATLAASHFLFEKGDVDPDFLRFHSCAGPLAVHKETQSGTAWLFLNFPACPIYPCSDEDKKPLAPLLSSLSASMFYRDALLYVAVLESEDAVARYRPDFEGIKTLPCRALVLTARADKGRTYDFVSRYFAPRVGITEDPVCGSAHCRLTPFWARILHKKNLYARQLSRRDGLLKVTYQPGAERVILGGQARTILRGTLDL
ncbi:hypothetical protein AGMMS49949_07310 [Alphaproteobacteria bacterium]|nr:hypothetical protein AGMMS49949_07310 [Alphaproteobacteria bacterium]